jgi:hypothetical protein
VNKPYLSGPSAGEESPFPGNSPTGGARERSTTGGYQSRHQPGDSSGYGRYRGSGYGGSSSSGSSSSGYGGSGYSGSGYSGSGYGSAGYGEYSRAATDTYEPPPTDRYEDYPDGGDDPGPPDTRWRWVAGLAAMVLLVALIAIGVAMRGDDTSPNSTTAPTAPSGQPGAQDAITTTAPRTVIATVPPATTPPPAGAALPPETVVTVTPSPPATAAAPSEAPPAPPEPASPAQTITYTVTGSRQLFDLVSIIYTDEQGLPRTDVNVALPWIKTVVLNPGVVTKSVTATSLTGQLNCSVTDGTGTTISAQANNAAITTCTS